MDLPSVVSADEWQQAHEGLLAKEKEATRARDALAAERRRLPMIEIEKDYVFEGPDGAARFLDMFEGRRQLIVYHFMFHPGAPGWPEAGCDGCSMFVDEALGSVRTFLDLTPLGRQEEWEDSPDGYPQTPPYEWWQRHDEYEEDR